MGYFNIVVCFYVGYFRVEFGVWGSYMGNYYCYKVMRSEIVTCITVM